MKAWYDLDDLLTYNPFHPLKRLVSVEPFDREQKERRAGIGLMPCSSSSQGGERSKDSIHGLGQKIVSAITIWTGIVQFWRQIPEISRDQS
jgi:hypothetical protein